MYCARTARKSYSTVGAGREGEGRSGGGGVAGGGGGGAGILAEIFGVVLLLS